MQIMIYGKPGCPYCDEAKALCKTLSDQVSGVDYQYICIREAGIGKEELERMTSKEVRTVPQIFVGDQHVGGYVELKAFVDAEFSLK